MDYRSVGDVEYTQGVVAFIDAGGGGDGRVGLVGFRPDGCGLGRLRGPAARGRRVLLRPLHGAVGIDIEDAAEVVVQHGCECAVVDVPVGDAQRVRIWPLSVFERPRVIEQAYLLSSCPTHRLGCSLEPDGLIHPSRWNRLSDCHR